MDNISSLSFILHVSDFHLTDGENKSAVAALRKLAEKLHSEGIKVNYLLHTGDVIDSSDLYEKTAAELSCCENYRKEKESGNTGEKEFDVSLFEKTAPPSDKQAFNHKLKELTEQRFSDAVDVIRDLISTLNISPGNVVICCGNHDVLRPLTINEVKVSCKKDAGQEKEGWKYECGTEVKTAFQPFEDFLDKLQTANSQTRCDTKKPVTQFPLDNLNILLLNTSWKNPPDIRPGYYCARCDQFKALLKENIYRRPNTLNIVMAHKPIYEICEKARLSYKRYIKTPFMADLQEFINGSGIYLCGDKHTRSIVGSHFHDIPHYIGGEPLTIINEETKCFEVEYNLLEISNNCIGIERKVHLKSMDGAEWCCDLRPQDNIISDLYNGSKDFLVENVLETISMSKVLHTWENLCQQIYGWNHPERTQWYTNLDNLYKAICKYRECGTKEVPWPEDNIFVFVCNRLKNRISENALSNILNIRGENSSGKSTFLGLLYIYLLYQYSIGLIDFIPAYFNLENHKVLEKAQKNVPYHIAVRQIFESFTEELQTIAQREHQHVCYIIDGLDEQDCWSYSSEDSIGRGVLDVLSKCDGSYYLMSFSQHHLPRFKDTMPVRMYNDTSDIIYFNPISIQEEGSSDTRFTSFIDAFMHLKEFPKQSNEATRSSKDRLLEDTRPLSSNIETRYNIIRRFRRLTVNPGFMYHNFDYIMNMAAHQNADVDNIYKYYIDRQHEMCLEKLGYGFIHYAPAMAYLFSYKGYTYERFKRLKEDYSLREHHIFGQICENHTHIYDAFLFIKKQKDASEYLMALHYNRELRYYAEHPDEEIEWDSILNDLITRNVAILIRKLWSDTNKFVIVCEKLIHRNDLSNSLLSMLIYCLAHQRMYTPFRDQLHKELQAKAKNTLDMQRPQTGETNIWLIESGDNVQKLKQFIDLSLDRTMKIFEFMDEDDSISLVAQFMADRELCKYNRQYQMLYYGDLSIQGEDKKRPLVPGNDIVYKGFDFHNTFHYLYVKLASNDVYPLREFDMFTMWDLIRSRLLVEHLQKQPYKCDEPNTFFYWRWFQEKADKVLERAYNIFEEYLKESSFKRGKSIEISDTGGDKEKVIKYFTCVQNCLKRIVKIRKNGNLSVKDTKNYLEEFEKDANKSRSFQKKRTKT